jgi:hypothetical protein
MHFSHFTSLPVRVGAAGMRLTVGAKNPEGPIFLTQRQANLRHLSRRPLMHLWTQGRGLTSYQSLKQLDEM